ncbi:hypothetical protein B0H17DRAFT_1049224 [Mycena rosella]|uniref:Uncharacterized protein n=1 Tax=Mycena rosella TaxID=1033263 RepID=A0AAD7DW36_MYCRO|nr:hypothetical protein B0H17DRAFT_1049224 [Mycena rosella]
MANSGISLRLPRLITLSLAWAWAVISLGIEINAFVKSNRDKKAIRNEVPPPTTVSVNTNDVFQSGAVVTTVSAVILVLCTLYIGLLLLDNRRGSGLSTRTLAVQYLSLGFFAIWLFATQIAVSHFVATRSVKVDAFLGGVKLPDNVVGVIERALGAKTKYSSYSYLKLLAILPWFTFLFTLIAAVVAFMASRRPASSDNVETTKEKVETTQTT